MGRSAWAPRGRGRLGTALALICLLAACSSAPPPRSAQPPPAEPVAPDGPPFDAGRAWEDARRIASYGSLAPGSRGARKARSYIRKQLAEAGVAVDELVLPGPKTALLTVVGGLKGRSSDVFLLVAALDADLPDDDGAARVAASGPATLLELARSLVAEPRPYTIWLAFVEGDLVQGDDPARPGLGAAHAEMPAAERFAGSRALAAHLAEAGQLDRIRMAVWLDAPGRADLVVARDMRSHRAYREIFWQSAQGLGETGVFADAAEYERAETGHLVFADGGMRRVVAIAPRSLPGESPPTEASPADDERRARRNMAAVGRVTLRSLEQVGERLQRIDGFARSPLSDLPGEPAEPATARDGSPVDAPTGSADGLETAVPPPDPNGGSTPPAARRGPASAD